MQQQSFKFRKMIECGYKINYAAVMIRAKMAVMGTLLTV